MESDEERENKTCRKRWDLSGESHGDQIMGTGEGFSKKLMADLGSSGW